MSGPVRVRSRTDPSQPAGSPDIAINWFADSKASSVTLQTSTEWSKLPRPSRSTADLLGIAVAVYVADRSIIREDQTDGWTRDIILEVPVSDPHRWTAQALDETLSFLTGDRWSVRLRRGSPAPLTAIGDRPTVGPELIALFSGGVDSLASAFELLSSGTMTALASYFGDGPTGGLQRILVAHLEDRYGVELLTYRFRLAAAPGAGQLGSRWPGFVDRTTRSRSFLFLALGVLIADMYGVEVVRMAENGFIAVNVPLHGGRAGSLSTRTAHPYFVERFNNLLSDSGIGIAIDNPFLLLTKGDASERLVAMAEPELIGQTISCAHPIGRWQGEGYRNCGYCYPCLIRRAGFHKTGSDPTQYSVNPLTDAGFYSDRPASASDIRSVARSLLDPVRAGDILATGPIATYELLTNLHEMRQRGVGELRSLLTDLPTQRVRQLLGL